MSVVPARPAAVGEQAGPPVPAPLEAADHRAHPLVRDRLLAMLRGLADVVEDQLAAAPARHVLTQDGGQAVAAVLHRVLVPARPEKAQVNQPDGRGQDPVPGQRAAVQMIQDDRPHPGQHGPELQHPVMLLPVALLTPPVVVAVLPPPRGIGTDGLDVPVRGSGDPHVLPGGRDDQGLDPGQDLRITQWRTLRAEVAEPAAVPPAPDTRPAQVAAHQGHEISHATGPVWRSCSVLPDHARLGAGIRYPRRPAATAAPPLRPGPRSSGTRLAGACPGSSRTAAGQFNRLPPASRPPRWLLAGRCRAGGGPVLIPTGRRWAGRARDRAATATGEEGWHGNEWHGN